MYLLDSNILIDFFNKGVPIPEEVLNSKISISLINYIEVEIGNRKSQKRKNASQVFNLFLELSSVKTIEIDMQIAEKYLEIRLDLEKRGTKLPDFDMLIAATALVHNLTLVTNNKKHFERIHGLKVLE